MSDFWNGFEYKKFLFEGHKAKVVLPKAESFCGHLAVKTEYWDSAIEAAEIELLNRGFVLCYIENDNRFGMNEDLDRKARFIRYVQRQYGLSSKCVPIGMSCGGLIAIKFAARYPELIHCLYLDAPVMNYMSWPCGFGIGHADWSELQEEVLGALKLDNLSQLLTYRDMPMDHLHELVENRIPVILVSGDSDQLVPYVENGILLERAYKDAGITLEVYIKPGGDHHPHGLPDGTPIIEFIISNTISRHE